MEPGQWTVTSLEASARLLPSGKLQFMPAGPPLASVAGRRGVALVGQGAGSAERWLLLASRLAGVRVNGAAVPLGICRINDKDEIVVASRRHFFSAERLVKIEPLPADLSASCPRCKQPAAPGRLAVQCPACGVWHDQDPEANRECWTYGETCAACHAHPTALDAGFRWTPEDL